MKLRKESIVLALFPIAIILHIIFHLSSFSDVLLRKIDSVAIILTIIVASAGIAYILARGAVSRARWAYMALLVLFDIVRLYLVIEYIHDFTPVVSYEAINNRMIVYSAVLSFVFVYNLPHTTHLHLLPRGSNPRDSTHATRRVCVARGFAPNTPNL